MPTLHDSIRIRHRSKGRELTATSEFLSMLRDGLAKGQCEQARLLVGVSGGADSVALLLGLVELTKELSLSLTVAHFNHRLRGAASDADAAWVESLARSLQLPVEFGAASDDLALGTTGIEESARDARLSFLRTIATRLGCQAVVLAHNADDQVETVLHHLFRGTGLSGLRGIPADRLFTQSDDTSLQASAGIKIVRPMLSIRRRQIEAYLQERQQNFCTDATNADTRLTRNWLRHELLPLLRNRFGVQIDNSLLRLSEQAAELESALTTLADRLLDQVLLDAQPNIVRINVKPLASEPRPLVREVFVQLWHRQRWQRGAMTSVHWNRLADLAMTPGATTFPDRVDVSHRTPGLMILTRQG